MDRITGGMRWAAVALALASLALGTRAAAAPLSAPVPAGSEALTTPGGRAVPPATADWVPFVGQNYVACTQGNPSPGGVCDNHHSYTGAVDINMAEGTSVYAAGAGVVVYLNSTCAPGDSGCEGGAGRWVGIEHPDGKVSRYLHLATVTVALGESVARGDPIGTSGSTGNAVVPHLHYDEQQPLWTRSVLGEMLACHGSSIVRYPQALGYSAWEDVPYGSVLRNDGYDCAGDLFVDVPASSPFFAEIAWLAGIGVASGYPDGAFRPTDAVTRQSMAAYFHRLRGSPPGPFPDPGLTDVPADHPFFTEIAWMVATGRASGYEDGSYRPLECVSRQTMAVFLWRENGSPPGPFPDPGLADVPADHPFFAEIAWMVSVGAATGYADGTFRPLECVSRQGTAAFLHRLYAGGA